MAQRAWENESATELTVRQRSPKAPFYFWISPLSDLMGLRQLYWCWPSVLTLCCDCLILVKIISLWPLCLLGVNMWRRTRLRYMDCVTQRQITRWWDSGLTFDRQTWSIEPVTAELCCCCILFTIHTKLWNCLYCGLCSDACCVKRDLQDWVSIHHLLI